MGLLSLLLASSFTIQATFALLLILISLALRQTYLWYRLRHIPGPWAASWSVWWQLRGAMSGNYPQLLKEVTDQYGPLVRIGPNQLVTSDPETLRRVSAVRGNFTKGGFYKAGRLVPGVDNVVSTMSDDKHKALRAQIAPAYAMRANHEYSFEASMDRQIGAFTALLETKYLSTPSDIRLVDMAEKTQFLALDIIGDISVGNPFGYLEKDQDLYHYNHINHSSLSLMSFVSVLPWLTGVLHRWPFRLILPNEGDNVGFGRLMGFITTFIEFRMQQAHESKGHDMMQIHMNSGLAKRDLIQQGFIAIIAGSNSTAHTLRMTLLSLITAPLAYKALQAEIDAAGSSVSSPVAWREVQQLPYLQAVVKEGLRMWPPIGGLGFKRVPPGGECLNGYFVPGGTEIGQAFLAVGRSEALWGHDAAVFRPERWIGLEPSDLRRMNAIVDTHFGGGKFSCLGRPIALMELHKALFELMKRFDMSVLNAEKPLKTKASVFVCDTDFWMTIRKR